MPQGDYTFSRDQFPELLIAKHFPERTDRESVVILAFLRKHLDEFDGIVFGKRLGPGIAPDPTHLPAIQEQTRLNTTRRLDIYARRGSQPVLIEVKVRVTPAALGQILTYRHFFLEENPDAPEPELVVVGAQADEDAVAVLQAHGVTVYVYAEANASPDVSGGSV